MQRVGADLVCQYDATALMMQVDQHAFFFPSRRRHTIYWRDWSSDVCSSDLHEQCVTYSAPVLAVSDTLLMTPHVQTVCMVVHASRTARNAVRRARSEERRVGKGWRSGWTV